MASSSTDAIVVDTLSRLQADSEGQNDWRACGSEVHACLLSCLQQLAQQKSISSLSCDLSHMLSLAQDAIKSVHHSKVLRKWRRLYTDTCILKGLTIMSGLQGKDSEADVMNAIKDLDKAIIICGAPGLDRIDMIHQIIALLQKEVPMPMEFPFKSPPKRAKAQEAKEERSIHCLASKIVKELRSIPSLSDYLSSSHDEPFIVRNFASSWPAIRDEAHDWADGKYLAQIGGPGRVVPVEIGWQYTESDWYQDVIPWQQFLQITGWNSTEEDKYTSDNKDKPRYMAQHNLFRQFPALESDIIVPDIIYSCPPAPSAFAQYRPPIDEDGFETTIVNAWIGPKGTTTPAHFDPYYNAYIQVVGQKLVWIAPPDVFSSSSSAADGTLMDGNSSTLPVFDQNTKGTEQSVRAYALGSSAVLGPGDLLILPPGWFHAVRSLSRSFSVSMWY